MEPLGFACPGLEDGGTFPPDHTGRGRDLSPEIRLENLSPSAKTLAVTLEDLSHPIKAFTHWVLWNYPAGPVIPGGLPRGKRLENGAVQGTAYGLHRYAGPKPPPFARHRYRLTVYALDCLLNLPPSARKRQFLQAAEGHILQAGSLTARFP
ncbi:YbhB/YbcL family Raf kinase inhibitor-like protein [uncultured Oscillibacter sp.]|uniref:YbhB/YbcL family Raf kinase inhibitor-like protein n=1 Tax=uncultured Oscillibacter sp. TaxID=876091 RepID=UPI002628FCA0|nr:YbhB/YbcL family Raf kinase inhibitor-like protein [uncultured Oscillibacter sp.]